MFDRRELQSVCQSLPEELRDTPFVLARKPGLSFKLETMQPTGSYKIRAAYSKLQKLRELKDKSQGVALSSSGNFAGAFTWAGAKLGLETHLVVTSSVLSRKMELAQQYPCQVHISGESYESRFEKLAELGRSGILPIDHRTDRDVFLGHSTVGWECLAHKDKFDRILIPVSTGGLALGVAVALRSGGFEGEILGVQPEGNPTLYESWKKGEPHQSKEIDTICDALTATSVPQETFDSLRIYLDDILLVSEKSVQQAVGFLALEEGLIAEPGACVGVAALLELQRPWKGSLCLLSGRNLSANVLQDSLRAWQDMAREYAGSAFS